MRGFVSLVGGALLFGSLPYWLPGAVVALRNRLFTFINGEEGIPIPGPLVDAEHFRQVYADPASNGRSQGAPLSDLFWYWLAPGPELHQEHLEPGERYDEVALTTRRILAISRQTAEELTTRCLERVLDRAGIRDATLVRLRDLMMPVWADIYYELVFGKPCPPHARQLIVDNANDVVTALKGTGLRHLDKRDRLTRFLVGKIEAGEVPHALPKQLSFEQQAIYLQGVFFNTAVVQSSEAMAHLFMALAQHPEIQAQLVANLDDERYLDRVMAETFRLYPLFGISHRITSAAIAVDEHTTIPRGSVLCFNHPEYHRTGYQDPERFDPDRWERLSPRDAHYIPFGVAGNRPCPAIGLAPITMRAAARAMLQRNTFATAAEHTRSMPNRGPCLLIPKATELDAHRQHALLFRMHLQDRWEDVGRSLIQLVLGTYMVWEARRLRLCERYFATHDSEGQPTYESAAANCPVIGDRLSPDSSE
jgi:hypothetical protein